MSLVRGDDYAQAVRDAIALIGGLPDLTGKTVFIKPNLVNADGPPVTTSPEVIRGIIQACKAQCAQRIMVGDNGMGTSTVADMDTLGIADVCSKEGAETVELTGGTQHFTPTGAVEWPNGIDIFQTVVNADYVINAPTCKTHGSATAFFSMAIKAWFGIIPTRSHRTNLGNQLAEIHLALQEDLAVIDATQALLTGGPSVGANDLLAEPNMVVVSTDPIAADVTGVCILKQYLRLANRTGGSINNQAVWDMPQIRRAMALQIGSWLTGKQDFPYDQKGVDEHADIMGFRA